MEKRKRILELRDRLDRTLAMPDLAEEASLRALVKKQILASSLPGSDQGDIDLIAETRAKEVSEFLEMLDTSRDGRSSKVHGLPQKEWKVKQDTDQLRVMYREGPEGTPFHTLLAEGFADGPIDVSNLFIRYLEERVKVPWPVSEREAILHYFELEYLKEDVVIVIMKTLSDLDAIDVRTHGFSRDGIPEAGDTVRIDVFGGFVLQRITKERSFFRAIANMDIKLDFVPPWLINFMSRQLIGSGHKLYQKAVSTVASHDDDYRKALRGPLYVRIREYQDSDDKAKVAATEENATEAPPDNATTQNRLSLTNTVSNSEIVEESEQNTSVTVDSLPTSQQPYVPVEQAWQVGNRPYTSPEVERALCILDTSIALLRGDDKAGNVTTLQNLLSYDASLEASTAAGSVTCQTNVLNADSLPNGHPVAAAPQDSREKASDSAAEEEDAGDENSLKNPTASTVTKSVSMTLRSAIRVHGEESLDTDGFFHQNGFSNSKESRRARKSKKRWPCCLIPTTMG
ncbi:hypothetical protein ZEAMMB73_Zm00001d052922 [Zea mays]|uniref:Uncharacterized protein n=1 Tax=Zea mays TaxID=4577 RepID=A0A1D6QKW3_MAIZE|nr:hypothetical protein ZEAMMB73_Zm00001d052922 [Zea mays]AQK58351.1 hypothetical protein ZEAMMB73_Zm00001d052922 [Zea mays]